MPTITKRAKFDVSTRTSAVWATVAKPNDQEATTDVVALDIDRTVIEATSEVAQTVGIGQVTIAAGLIDLTDKSLTAKKKDPIFKGNFTSGPTGYTEEETNMFLEAEGEVVFTPVF